MKKKKEKMVWYYARVGFGLGMGFTVAKNLTEIPFILLEAVTLLKK